ncbi:hypothetical protein E3N88_03087 [Mikania micrantha]|uniref:Retrotransposon Copia-like N-terminal domain-containing protein n=1 Tax=Mikania micrantha TaxID=192012 RepID=A0A5N6Q7X2_9ASTR|nr:hypothetical protein E3N88_03087 [Mikania micrantha]
MAITTFTIAEKTNHNSHKFGFKLSPTNYGYWKTMIKPFLITNSLYDYIDGSLPCPSQTIVIATSSSDKDQPPLPPKPNPEYSTWVSNDAHVRMLLLSTISESSFKHVQGDTSRDLWLSLERAYAPHTSSREYTLRTQLLKMEMQSDETSTAYITRAQEYNDALANIGAAMQEKDVIMLIISGLREEYNALKPTLIARHPPVTLLELPGLLADHEYMTKRVDPTLSAVPQSFTATNSRDSASHNSLQLPPETVQSLQQLMTQLGFTVQPAQQPNQAYYSTRGQSTRDRSSYNNNRRGRGNYNRNTGSSSVNNSRFAWASNQNTVYGSCNSNTLRAQLVFPMAQQLHIMAHCWPNPNTWPNTGPSPISVQHDPE